jgi:hypothetical protein
MSGNWFSNRGQVIQIALAALACFFTGRELIVDFIAKTPPNTWVMLGFFCAFAVFLMLVYRGTLGRGLPVTDVKPTDEKAPHYAGPIKKYREKVKIGDFWRCPDEQDFRLEMAKASKSKEGASAISEYTIEVVIPSRGYGFKTANFVTRNGDNRYSMPVATFDAGHGACSIVDVRITTWSLTAWTIHLEHYNPEAKVVELVVSYVQAKLT